MRSLSKFVYLNSHISYEISAKLAEKEHERLYNGNIFSRNIWNQLKEANDEMTIEKKENNDAR